MSEVTPEQVNQFMESVKALKELDTKISEIEKMDPEYKEKIRQSLKPLCSMIIDPFMKDRDNLEKNLETSIRKAVEEARDSIYKSIDHIKSFIENDVEDVKEVKSE